MRRSVAMLMAAVVLSPAAPVAGAPRRAPARAPVPTALLPESPELGDLARRLQELQLRAQYGDDWDEVLVETADGDVEGLLARHGGSWRARGLGKDAVRRPGNRHAVEWALEVAADPQVRRLEPNPRAVHPGCRQMTIDILESGSQLLPELATQPALAPASGQGLEATGVVVAILDSGVAPLEELRPALLPAIDVLHPRGARVVSDETVLSEHAADAHGHGTAMASLVAAVARGAVIQPVRVVGADCDGTAFDVAAGLAQAADGGATVALVSLSTRHDSPVLRRAVEDAVSRGVLVVAAAGNDQAVEYPAAYPGVLAVTAVGPDAWPPSFAPLGTRVDIAAPGVDVEALGPTSTVALTGTSPAAALVAGAAARAARLMPGAGPAAWAERLEQAARPAGDVSPSLEGRLGAGLLDLAPLK